MQLLQWLKSVCAALTALLIIFGAAKADTVQSNNFLVYFGTYTGAKSKGIYVSHFDAVSGKLSAPGLTAETVNPSFLAVAPNHQFLFAVNETSHFAGQYSGSATAFKLDAPTEKLEFLNNKTYSATDPYHLV